MVAPPQPGRTNRRCSLVLLLRPRHASSLVPSPGAPSSPWHMVALRCRPRSRWTPPIPAFACFGSAIIFTPATAPRSSGQPHFLASSCSGLFSRTCGLRHCATTRISGSLLCFIFSRFIAGRPGCRRNLQWPSYLPPPPQSPPGLASAKQRTRKSPTGSRHHPVCPALLDQLCRDREMGRRGPPRHDPLGQPASTSDRDHDCSVFTGRGPACAFSGSDCGLSGRYGQLRPALCPRRTQFPPLAPHLRIAADATLLTPLALFPFAR